jgi:hypothetical protein
MHRSGALDAPVKTLKMANNFLVHKLIEKVYIDPIMFEGGGLQALSRERFTDSIDELLRILGVFHIHNMK